MDKRPLSWNLSRILIEKCTYTNIFVSTCKDCKASSICLSAISFSFVKSSTCCWRTTTSSWRRRISCLAPSNSTCQHKPLGNVIPCNFEKHITCSFHKQQIPSLYWNWYYQTTNRCSCHYLSCQLLVLDVKEYWNKCHRSHTVCKHSMVCNRSMFSNVC